MSHKRGKAKIEEAKDNWRKPTGFRPVRVKLHSISKNIHFLKEINEWRKIYKEYKKNIPEHNKYSADPIIKIFYPLYEQLISKENPMVYEEHVRQVMEELGGFLMYVLSVDTCYRPMRNWALHHAYTDENIKKIREALAKEREVEDYLDPNNWYDNMKVISKKITKDKQTKGLIPKDSISTEQASYVDELTKKQFKEKAERKEV